MRFGESAEAKQILLGEGGVGFGRIVKGEGRGMGAIIDSILRWTGHRVDGSGGVCGLASSHGLLGRTIIWAEELQGQSV